MTTHKTMREHRSARDVLAWSRSVVDPALRTAVDTLPGSIRHITGYHFGWWDEHGDPCDGQGGKAFRPALVLLSAEAVEGPARAAISGAVAVELVHNFSLLHDDVMDGDLTRRHRPTAWSVFGTNAAILAGDSLLALAFDVLAASGHPDSQEGLRLLSAAVQSLVDGQSADTSFENRTDVQVPECVRMAQHKTGALTGCACAIGALFGGARPAQVRHLHGFGADMGLAFQFIDDLLGIWGDPAVTGKPVFSDLHNRKKSLPVVAAIASGTAAGRELAELYHRERPLSGVDVERAAELIELAGGRDWSHRQADDLLAAATEHLRAASPAAGPAGELGALARLATRRDH